MTVTDADVGRIIPMIAANPDDGPAAGGSVGFYMRSFPMQVRQLRQVLQSWDDSGLVFEEAQTWTQFIEHTHKTEEDFVFIRYVGTFGPTSTALTRFDLDFKRVGGVLSNFCGALERIIQSLLNRQAGGFFAAWEPRAEDQALYESLDCQVLSSTLLELRSAPTEQQVKLAELFNDISDFIVEHPVLTGTSRISPASDLKSVMLRQATPSTVNGNVLLAVIGKDITVEDFLEPRFFIQEEGSRAGHLLFLVLKLLQQWEQGLATFESSTGTNMTSMFPFYEVRSHPVAKAHSLRGLARLSRAVLKDHQASCSRFLHEVDLVRAGSRPCSRTRRSKYRNLESALRSAKEELRTVWSSINAVSQIRELPEEERVLGSFKAANRARLFVAEGVPGSAERKTQTLSMWRLNWPDLHVKFDRTQRGEWFSWANNLVEGKSFFASAVAIRGDAMRTLCQAIEPSG
ncbi:unnamed protein product [Tilletia laevis]|uniref:Uncharacterized protein n=1 Tax=Tilletia laevis TaxID=157183 RepID=A0A9N8QHC6_9BASI|nr:unnamed protein product [Tilletia caries]CAD6940326.1 unnamed protein product [Tilletia caries]CAD6947302.1 unnamed protein product [Tilletia laevis]CAD6954168.1 unnamed protein product [Tilletia laevis]